MPEKSTKPKCPVCRRETLVLQGTKDNPMIRPALHGNYIWIPMRCTACGINCEIRRSADELEDASQ